MSIIAVYGIPPVWSLKTVLKQFAKKVNGFFEALNFTNSKDEFKTCYLRLSPKLDPVRVIENITNGNFGGRFKFEAYVPEFVPDLPLGKKPKQMPKKLRRKLHIEEERIPDGILKKTHSIIMVEMQHKYPGLQKLFMKTNYDLYYALSEIIHNRLIQVLEAYPEAREKCFFLSKLYRRSHPHFVDFQLILKTLHDLEQEAGLQRTQLSEKTLSAVTSFPNMINNVPVKNVKEACSKYSKKILNKVVEHLDGLDVITDASDTKEEMTRKRVRNELKKMSPFVPEMIRQVISNHFVVPQPKLIRMYLYGEPFLPNKDIMMPFMKSHSARKPVRSKFMYNLMLFEIVPERYDNMMALDGTTLNCGAKLVIRPANLPIYKHKNKKNKKDEEQELEEEDGYGIDVDSL